MRPLYHVVDKTNPLYAKPYDYPQGFLWGRSSVADLWEELILLGNKLVCQFPMGFISFPWSHRMCNCIGGHCVCCWCRLGVRCLEEAQGMVDDRSSCGAFSAEFFGNFPMLSNPTFDFMLR